MPISTSLAKCCTVASRAPSLPEILDEMGIHTCMDLLCAKASFMEGALSETQAQAFIADILKTSAGKDTYPKDTDVQLSSVRVLLYSARNVILADKAADSVAVSVSAADDPFKSLPPSELLDVWAAAAKITDGYAMVDDDFRLSAVIMSRMIREGKAGGMWIPPIGIDFKYQSARENREVSTLMRGAGNTEMSVQMVSQSDERKDDLLSGADYSDMLSHRSVALMAVYCSNAGAERFQKSAKCAETIAHSLSTGAGGQRRIVTPQFIGTLERRLRQSARMGVSADRLIAIDRAVIDAVLARMSKYKGDGDIAIEHVLEQREILFHGNTGSSSTPGTPSLAGSLDDVGSVRDAGGPTKRERDLQSQVDKLLNQGKGKPGQHTRTEPTIWGGSAGKMGGGAKSGDALCNDFNKAAGCFRATCKFRHCCNVKSATGDTCGRYDHCAVGHK